MASSSSTEYIPCAACRVMRRRCTQECVFAPHFPSTQPQKYECVHKVFGASNVAKLLSELPFDQRDDAVASLVFEAELNLKNPVYGCVGLLSFLKQHLNQVQDQLAKSREELATYVGPDQAMRPILQTQHQLFEAQQLAAVNAVAREQEELFRAYGGGGGSNNPHHQNNPQVDRGFDTVPTGSITVAGFNQLGSGGTKVTGMSPYVALGGNFVGDNYRTDHQLHHQQQEQHGTRLFMPTQSSQMLPPQTHETQMFMPTQSSQHQPYETQMFTPPQSSQPQPFQPQETRIFMPTQSSQMLLHETHETQMFTPPQSSQSLPIQPYETEMFMPTQSSHSPPHQTQETQIFMPTQSSQLTPHQTQETQMFIPTQSSQSTPHQTQETQILIPTQSIPLQTQETQTKPDSESEGGRMPWLITKKLEFKK